MKDGMNDREKDKFVATSAGDTSVRVTLANSLLTVAYDYVSVNYATATQEIYTFYSGGAGGTLVATITVNYTDATKANVSNVGRT